MRRACAGKGSSSVTGTAPPAGQVPHWQHLMLPPPQVEMGTCRRDRRKARNAPGYGDNLEAQEATAQLDTPTAQAAAPSTSKPGSGEDSMPTALSYKPTQKARSQTSHSLCPRPRHLHSGSLGKSEAC
ncbi:hypothetical protein KIL84_021372 [Mauremys mutica]|uniref:Uncharacterized protein n=1 Tax=Mauremys mutica TaxID=74926 RepID=A0A9D4AY83_9SAUR|nr:hypothetical protein KIL84_021372 [Mauremys mutica]